MDEIHGGRYRRLASCHIYASIVARVSTVAVHLVVSMAYFLSSDFHFLLSPQRTVLLIFAPTSACFTSILIPANSLWSFRGLRLMLVAEFLQMVSNRFL